MSSIIFISHDQQSSKKLNNSKTQIFHGFCFQSSSSPSSTKERWHSGVTLTGATTKEFSHWILEKLTNSNYLLRCQQVESVIKGHRLHHLLTNPQIPLDTPLLPIVILEIPHLSSYLGGNKISSYTCGYNPPFPAKFFQDSLVANRPNIFGTSFICIFSPLSENVNIVLDGLPDEFESLITFVSGKFESLSVDEVATLLLAHETRLSCKKALTLINLTKADKSSFSLILLNNSSSNSGSNYNNYNGGNRFFNSGCGGGRGRGCYSNVQCQICHKNGHEASFCYYRHDDDYDQNQNPNCYPNQNSNQPQHNQYNQYSSQHQYNN
ncbi:hypothetical protein GLYMA_18G129000v4 [Glycine max]|uniref:Uncharacterized protein n=1 Tax=Glycine max TaxID=3847 RepID=A0A0R0F7R9_SOYBN|nr:hypothetical protein GYH30_049829 [Glycine max]KRG99202.1 hypothetical protein GLYMA_18G129000v4 [Glycine max]